MNFIWDAAGSTAVGRQPCGVRVNGVDANGRTARTDLNVRRRKDLPNFVAANVLEKKVVDGDTSACRSPDGGVGQVVVAPAIGWLNGRPGRRGRCWIHRGAAVVPKQGRAHSQNVGLESSRFSGRGLRWMVDRRRSSCLGSAAIVGPSRLTAARGGRRSTVASDTAVSGGRCHGGRSVAGARRARAQQGARRSQPTLTSLLTRTTCCR